MSAEAKKYSRQALRNLTEELDRIRDEIGKHTEAFTWQELADMGHTVEAVKRYRALRGMNACYLKEAHDAVRNYQLERAFRD